MHSGNEVAKMGEAIKTHDPPGTMYLPDTCLPELLRPGKGTNAHPTGSVPLQSTQEHEWLRPGKCTKYRACFGQFPFRATRSLSSVEWKSIGAIKVKVKIAQLCPTLCDPMDFTVHVILQARILDWVVFPFSRGSSQTRD